MKTFLNLGCGSRLRESWTNADLQPSSPGIIPLNALDQLPFENDSFEVIYMSHVIEHIPRNNILNLLGECRRILGQSGIIRIVLPDLEQCALNYLACLNQGIEKANDKRAQENYEWAMLELYDQCVRTESGGAMKKFLARKNLAAEKDICARGGNEIRDLRKLLLNPPATSAQNKTKACRMSSGGPDASRSWLFRILWHSLPGEMRRIFQAGAFRLGGELHQWMYDRYSTMLLLQESGFRNIVQQNADTSAIPHWDRYNLDREPDGSEWKPYSLYMEAHK